MCKIETSKLFERFDREIPWSGAYNVFGVAVDDFGLPIGDVSLSTLLISVADDVNDESNVLKSEFVTIMPVRLKKLCVGDFAAQDADGVIVTGMFSDARRNEAAN